MRLSVYFSVFVLLLLLNACTKGRVYDHAIDVEDTQWKQAEALNYEFTIEDPTKEYDIIYYVRYNNEYPFYNFYVTQFLLDSANKEIFHKLRGMDIFHSKTGEPLGGGFGNIYKRDIVAFNKYKFPYKGKYTIKITQSMRVDPLPGIESLGVKIQESEPAEK